MSIMHVNFTSVIKIRNCHKFTLGHEKSKNYTPPKYSDVTVLIDAVLSKHACCFCIDVKSTKRRSVYSV